MDVGIFVTSLKPRSPSQARLQAAIFDGLSKVADGRYRFVVFSLDSLRIAVPGGFIHAPVARYGKWEELGRRLRANLCHALLRVWEFLGASGGRTWQSLTWLSRFEPKHFLQMRDHSRSASSPSACSASSVAGSSAGSVAISAMPVR